MTSAPQFQPRPRPKGARYRNLARRGRTIHYKREVGGRRIRFSCETADWDQAVAVRDLYEARRGIGRLPAVEVEVPTLAAFVGRYQAEDVSHLAATTLRDRRLILGPQAPLLNALGHRRLDDVTPADLRAWWAEHVEGAGRSPKTGRDHLIALSAVFGFAMDLGVVTSTPVPSFRQMLRRRGGTKRGRAEREAGQHIRPVETPDELARLVEAARAEGALPYALVLLMLDAGLRLGEALAVAWEQILWGHDEDDTDRALIIDRNRPRDGAVEPPKSGRNRSVPMSRRLRAALLELRAELGDPDPGDVVASAFNSDRFRRGPWKRICKAARLGGLRPKDLRDSFASWLCSVGAPLPFVQHALGHASWATTAQHYARWVPEASSRGVVALEPGEVWPDLLARQ